MSASNPNWDRWILASVADHFKTLVADVFTLKQFVEGQHRDTNNEEESFEVRIDGPFSRLQQKNCWMLVIEINCLISTSTDDFDFHRHRQNSGNVTSGYTNCINVFRYGTGPSDDQSLLGILKLQQGRNGRIVTTHFGQIDPRVKLQQTTIEGHYEMQLST